VIEEGKVFDFGSADFRMQAHRLQRDGISPPRY